MSLAAFTWIETALAILVLPTTNHIPRLSQENRVSHATAYLGDIGLDYIKSFHLDWDRSVLYRRWLADLAKQIVTPTVHLIKTVIQKPSC